MIFWIIATLTVVAVAALLLSAMRAGQDLSLTGAESDIAVYRDQLAEVDRDVARGVLTEAEAEGVRVEVSRRLLAADKQRAEEQAAEGGTTVAAVILVAIVAGVGLGLYAYLGAPSYSDQPLARRIAVLEEVADTRPGQSVAEERVAAQTPPTPVDQQFLELMEKLRAAVVERPDDVRGLELLARNEANIGNFAAARAAQEQLIAAKGNAASTQDRLELLELMVAAAGGYISPEAETVLLQIVAEDPSQLEARFYQGLMLVQTGRPDLAYPIWHRLIEVSPPDAPWVAMVNQELPGIAQAAGVPFREDNRPVGPAPLRGPTSEDMAAAQDMSDADRAQMIEGMVQGLADRLANEGGPPEEWARLIRALGVLGRTDAAREIADEALATFADNPAALGLITDARNALPNE